MKINRKKVLVAMSGGVDSSVAAQLLKNQGYQVAGIFLHFWKDSHEGKQLENRCCSLESLADARQVAAKVGIPLYTLDFSVPFKKAVVDNFLNEYAAGRTPNPCVVCNKQIKIGRLIKYAINLGYDYVATGHYLNIKRQGRFFQLFKAKDDKKDQSYFLYTFTQQELKHLLFPIWNLNKIKVRQLAEKFNLLVAHKSDSQDICFLAGAHNDFLKKYLELKSGPIKLLVSKEIIGKHQGLPLYTIGQRRGIEIGGTGPYYVAKLDYKRNILYVVKEWNQQVLYKKELIATKVNWLNNSELKKKINCEAVIRYGHKAEKCVVIPVNKSKVQVKFNKPQRAITPGQSIVFYNKKQVLGGGLIT